MAGATSGRLAVCGDFGVIGPLAYTGAAISGVGTSRACGVLANPDRSAVPVMRAQYSGVLIGVDVFSGFSGRYKIEGITKDGTTVLPVARRVLLSPAAAPGIVIRETFTDAATGAFSFTDLAPGKYRVWGVDVTAVQNDPIYDWVDAVPM
jgi:hypothetical protein